MRTIVISRSDKIGDFIVSIPSFATMRSMYPDARIVALVSKNNQAIAESLSCIDLCLSVDDYSEKELIQKLRELHCDAFIALVSNSSICRIAFKAKIPVRIGPKSKPLSFLVYNKGIRQHRSQCLKSEAEYNLDLIKHYDEQRFAQCGVQFEKIKFSLEDEALALDYLKQANLQSAKFIAVHPFDGGSGVNLSLEQYGQVLTDFLFKSKKQSTLPAPQILILAQKQHQELLAKLYAAIPSELHAQVQTCINTHSLKVACALISKCCAYMGGSTGITQIAGNYQKPVICFYAPYKSNSHARWQLFGDKEEVPISFSYAELDLETKRLKSLSDELKNKLAMQLLAFWQQAQQA